MKKKETDVNIALALIDLAYKDKYDHAFVISNDSDLAPAIRMVRLNFSQKLITTIVPPLRQHSNELIQASSKKAKKTIEHLERSLLATTICDVGGNIVATRPVGYSPSYSLLTV